MVGQVAQTRVRQARAHARGDRRRARRRRPRPRRARARSPRARLDDDVEELEDVLSVAVETARFSPDAAQRAATLMQRYERTMPQLDFAVRNTRVLARYAARQVRQGEPAPQPRRRRARAGRPPSGCSPRSTSSPSAAATCATSRSRAAHAAEDIHEREPSLLTTQIVGQIRSVAVDLVRAAETLQRRPRRRPPGRCRPRSCSPSDGDRRLHVRRRRPGGERRAADARPGRGDRAGRPGRARRVRRRRAPPPRLRRLRAGRRARRRRRAHRAGSG